MKKPNYRLLILFLMGAFGIMGGSLIAPALPALLEPFGVDEGTVGLVLSVYTLSAAFALPLTGIAIDRLGRRRVAVACLLIDGVFGLLCARAPDFTLLLIFRFLQGIGISGLIPVAMTVISDWYSGNERLRVMGLLSSTIYLSAVFIPLLGGLLGRLDWRLPFGVYGLSLILALFYIVGIEESGERKRNSRRAKSVGRHLLSLAATLRLPAVRHVFSQALILFFLIYLQVTFLPLFLVRAHGLNVGVAGLAVAFQNLFGALAASRTAFIDRFVNNGLKLAAGYCLLALNFAALPFWPNEYWLSAGLLFFGCGMGVLLPAVYNRVAGVSPPELTGSVIGLFSSVKFIGMSLAPLIGSFLFHRLGMNGVFAAGAVIAAAGALAGSLSVRSHQVKAGGEKIPDKYRSQRGADLGI